VPVAQGQEQAELELEQSVAVGTLGQTSCL